MNPVQKSLSDRMKEYENIPNARLIKRMPIMVRLDGRAFHTFTSKMKRPYDCYFMEIMDITTKYLKDNTPDCRIAYVESDEITLAIFPYKTFSTEPMFDARVQKLCSILASTATWIFNKTLNEWANYPVLDYDLLPDDIEKSKKIVEEYGDTAEKREFASKLMNGIAMFDARCWNLPREEVLNCFLWRQQDSKRNAILSAGQAWLGKKQIEELKCPEIIDKLLEEKDIDYWDKIPSNYHYGRTFTDFVEQDEINMNVWHFDIKEEREALEKLINCDEE